MPTILSKKRHETDSSLPVFLFGESLGQISLTIQSLTVLVSGAELLKAVQECMRHQEKSKNAKSSFTIFKS